MSRAAGRTILVYALLVTGAFLAILPMIWMVSASLMPLSRAVFYWRWLNGC